MKKNLRKILMIVTALLFALPLLLIAVSCKSVEPRSEADVIPDSLGTAEGLWLYKGNKRSRTDGTEEEKILTSVTVDETEYGEEEFQIIKYKYVRGTFEIFYVIQIEEDIRLYHYNYFTKISSDLYDLPDVSNPSDYRIEVSSSLVYVSNANKSFGLIFSRTAQLLDENFSGTLDGNIVYRLEGNEFVYFMNGEKRTVSLGWGNISSDKYYKCGNYAYFFGPSVYAVNLGTGEKVSLSAFDVAGGTFYMVDSYELGGSLYVVAHCVLNRNTEDEERLYRFIRIKGATAETVRDFGDVPNGVKMLIDGSTIYLVKESGPDGRVKYFSYDSKTGAIESVSKKTAQQGKSTELAKKEKANETLTLNVGDYTFYVTETDYDDHGYYYEKTCYYLIRRYGDFEEIMQYSLNRNGGYFYDDICEL